jgi:carbamoyltransferase
LKILGLSSNYHDASAALVVDGQVAFAAAEERFSRQKHDPNFPARAIRAGLKGAGLEASDLDLVVYHEDPYNKLSRSLAASLARWPFSLKSFLLTGKDAVTSGLRVHQDIAGQLGVDARKIVFAPHHMSHAALAFLASPFDEAAVMTIDAVGEWTSSAIFKARRNGAKGFELEPLHVSPFPHSLGLFYSSMTSYLGFKVNDGECSLMALAAFGSPRFLGEMRKIVRVSEDGSHELDLGYLDFRSDTELPVSKKFLDIFGLPRSYKAKIPFDCLTDDPLAADADFARYADIAASVQAMLQEAVVAYGRKAKALTGSSELCYSGGVALNCVANEELRRSGTFSSLYIPADPGDGGAALGAALYVAALKGETPRAGGVHPYQGAAVSPDELEAILPFTNPKKWPPFSPLATRGKVELRHRRMSQEETLKTVAEKIWEGKIVGWCEGPFEQGPRALGARSILVRADKEDIARRLSTRVKKRAAFRPYALSMTETAAAQMLEGCDSNIPHTARWMQTSMIVRAEKRKPVRYGLHVDGTTRPQVVNGKENPRFEKLLREYGKISGVEALVNTSFNEAGSPLVANHLDAFMMFARTEMDVLVIGDLILEKI